MVSETSAQISTVVTLLVIGAVVSVRLRRMKNGVRVTSAGTIGYLVVLAAISAVFVGESFYAAGIPIWFVIPYLATAAGSAYFGHRHSKSSLVFWKDSASGTTLVKGGIVIFAIYIGAMVARLTIAFLFIGNVSNPFGEPGTSLSAAAFIPLLIADFLMMLGVGLFAGRNIRIYQQYSMIKKGRMTIPEHK